MIDDMTNDIADLRDRIETLYPHGDPHRSTMMRVVNASEKLYSAWAWGAELDAIAILTLVRLEIEREEKRIRDAAEEDAYWAQREAEHLSEMGGV